MSFTVSYRDLGHPAFLSGMRKIAQSSHWKSHLVAYNVARVIHQLDEEKKTFDSLRSKMLLKYQGPAGQEKAKELEADLEEFGKVTFDVPRHRIKLEDAHQAGCTPSEILALDCLLEVPDGD